MKPYKGYAACDTEDYQYAACLIFANNHKEAKKLAWGEIHDWHDAYKYTDVRCHRIKDDSHVMTLCEKDTPHVADPPSCMNCGLWGLPLDGNNLCERCAR